ncbi:hypothetical protein Hanom_Chr08g00696951 [Helianthus anomalus]
MSKVVMGNNNLKVNIARFTADNVQKEENQEKSKQKVEALKSAWGTNNLVVPKYNQGKTYASLVSNFTSTPEKKVINVPINVDAFTRIHDRALVGRTIDFTSLRMFNVLLKEANLGYAVWGTSPYRRGPAPPSRPSRSPRPRPLRRHLDDLDDPIWWAPLFALLLVQRRTILPTL